MAKERFQKIDELFRAALALPAAQRNTFLKEQCGDDDAMRREVEALLTEDAATRGALDRPAFGEKIDLTASMHTAVMSEGPGTHIGPYKILQQIGEGGFGSVFMAEQSEPVIRRVALKIIKLGMDTKQVIARFEAERQALAIMNHANIAKVLDAGATATGRPYFVMEMCAGVPITEYCDTNSLSINERLELFAQVCRAVQHAHQKGVIHRDIKPSNVLVSTQDGQPFAKVIDFGIAKATNMRLTEKTMFTEHRQLIGTPAYMSPEQAEGALDIDTRTDVYSLGVLLYELLIGATPFDQIRLREAAYGELQRIIREDDPPQPSTRLSMNTDLIASIAAKRRIEPKQLGAMIRGELDWIVMKALDKDRRRRYDTASGLAMDIHRYLSGEVVLAAPPSTTYRVGKFIRRNKGPVAAAGVIAATLMLGVVGTSWGFVWALSEKGRADGEAIRAVQAAESEAEQRAIAEANEHRAIEEADRARAAEAEAQQRAEELELVALFQQSQLADIETALMGENIRRNILDKRRAALEARGMDEQAVTDMLLELEHGLDGVNFTNVALETLDENIFERALIAIDDQFADQPLVKARLLQTIADTLHQLGLYGRATAPVTEALNIRRRILGNEHPDTLISVSDTGAMLQSQGKLVEAEPYFLEALESRRRTLGDEHPLTLNSINNMGVLLQSQGKLAEAAEYYHQVIELRRRVLGDEDPDTLTSISNMGDLLQLQGKLAEAEQYSREALEARRRTLGDEHPLTLNSINNMGMLLQSQGKLDEAEPYAREVLEAVRRTLGDEHLHTLISINNMGMLLDSQGKLDEAEPYYREAMETSRRVLGDEHPFTLTSISNLGYLYESQGKLDEAESYRREVMESFRRVLGDEHSDTLFSIINLGAVLRRMGRLDEADQYGVEAVEIARRYFPADHWRLAVALGQHAETLAAMERFAEAEERSVEAVHIFESALGAEHARTNREIQQLAELYDRWHETEPEKGYDAKAAQWRAKLTSE